MRTNYCGEISADHIGSSITICGWLHRRRDHGGVIFLDIRDKTGIVQAVFNPDHEEAFKIADGCRSEFVLSITGKVHARSCLLYTSPSPRDRTRSRMPSSA